VIYIGLEKHLKPCSQPYFMALERVSAGNSILDNLLEGGYETDVVTTIYGPSGSGKTNMCMIALVSCIQQGKKVIFIDCEGGFSVARLGQIYPEFKQQLDSILLLKPMNFEDQKKAFEKLKTLVDTNIGMIIIDSISMLYRLQVGKDNDVVSTNRELGAQIAALTGIARKKNIPVLITSQVYSSFDVRDKVNLVGGDILKYGSKCLLELEKHASSIRSVIIQKHRSLPEGKKKRFRIVHEGIVSIDQEEKKQKREEKQEDTPLVMFEDASQHEKEQGGKIIPQ
jgi:DNA repair protein RadB